jgi:tRNA threonylcarbamoyl adenosine modification protein YjeE
MRKFWRPFNHAGWKNVNNLSLPEIKLSKPLALAGMEKLAQRFARVLKAGDMVTLRGEVGAGKTTFVRALIQALSPHVGEVTSPTFNLMQSYDVTLADGTPELLWHVDLYRLKDPLEAEALGLPEIEPHIVLMEWPEIISASLPPGRLDITVTFTETMEERVLAFYGNKTWRERIVQLW